MAEFAKTIGRLRELEISLAPGVAHSRRGREEIYGMPPLSAVERMEVRERGKIADPGQLRGLILDAARALDGMEQMELAFVLEVITEGVRNEESEGRRLVLYKMLEHVSAHTSQERIWRPVMRIFSDALVSEELGISIIGSVEREVLCAHCVRNIYERSNSDDKKKLAFAILTEALFDYEDRVMWNALDCIGRVDQPVALAAMIAFAARGDIPQGVQGALLDAVHKHGKAISAESGGNDALALIGGGAVTGPVASTALEGFAEILNARSVRVPHPYFLENPTPFPVPTFRQGGLHLSSFEALARMRHRDALGTLVSGIHQLVVPHIEFGTDGEIGGQRSVVRAVDRIADSLVSALKLRGVKSAADFTEALMNWPAPMDLREADRHAIRRMGHLFYRFSRAAEDHGTEKYPISKRAAMGLVLALLSGTQGRGSIYPWKLAAANAALISREYRKTFGSEGIVDDQKRIEFLAKIARGQLNAKLKIESIALPTKFEKGTAQKIEKK